MADKYLNEAGLDTLVAEIKNKFQKKISNTNTIPSDSVDDTNQAHKFATQTQLDAIEQNTNSLTALANRVTTSENNISNIESKISDEASATNQLADKAFVNSSISTATATFRGTYNLVSDLSLTTSATHSDIATALGTTISTADTNDYCFVQIPTSTSTPTEISAIERYKYASGWSYEYTLNNSGFTASQWAAINSGITSDLRASIPTKIPMDDFDERYPIISSYKFETKDDTTSDCYSLKYETIASKYYNNSVARYTGSGYSGLAFRKPHFTTISNATHGTIIALNYDTEPVSSSAKPISSGAVYKALNGKQNTIDSSHKLSASLIDGLATVATTGSYTDLTDIPTMPTDTNQKVKTSSVTFGSDDVVEIVAGNNVTVTGDAVNKTITIAAKDGIKEITSPTNMWELADGVYTSTDGSNFKYANVLGYDLTVTNGGGVIVFIHTPNQSVGGKGYVAFYTDTNGDQKMCYGKAKANNGTKATKSFGALLQSNDAIEQTYIEGLFS